MTATTISLVETHAVPELSIFRSLVEKSVLDADEYTALDRLHEFLNEVVEGVEKVEDAELFYGPGACELLTKDQAERFVDDWLSENKLHVGQSISNLMSENRRNSFTEASLKEAQRKGNRHRYGYCPYNKGRPLTYFKTVLMYWLKDYVRPEANVVELSS